MIAGLALPAAARADSYSSMMPSGDLTLHGVITSIEGKNWLIVQDDRAGTDRVMLHRGTVIGPTGLQLEPGMQVTIAGRPDGRTFEANKIDAPIQYLEAQLRARQAQENNIPQWPFDVPNGTFQTNGPSAEGGD